MDDIDAAEDVLVDLDLIDAAKGCLAHQQLVDEYSQCPVVHGPIMSAIQYNLRGHILGRAGKCVGLLIGSHILGKAKVDLAKRESRLVRVN